MELRNTLPSAGAPTNTGNRQPLAGGEQPGGHVVLLFLGAEEAAELVAQFGAGHLLLELRHGQDSREEAVLVQQDVFVKGHVGNTNGLLVAQGTIVAENRHFVHRPMLVSVETAVAVVIADGVGGAQIGHPAGFEQWDQPRLVLSGDRHRTGDGQSERAAHADGAVEDRIDAAQVSAAEGRQAVAKKLV